MARSDPGRIAFKCVGGTLR